MDIDKKQITDAHLDNIRRAWLLVIPAIIAIISSAVFTGIWLTAHSRADASWAKIADRINASDRFLLANIQRDSRSIYLQLLRSQISPQSDASGVESLIKELDELELRERDIMRRYDPSYVSIRPSAKEVVFQIMTEMPYPILFTISLGLGIFLFVIARYIALIIMNRRYPPFSNYTREV
ncbi:hypothetical conserved protein [Candidatus Nitrosoglobus terrae]|uniref:Hypothetical conserved protein n=1 Tax=Candidatus Nitrosoglobus terrae TaxID=1630141 RepID=A0A1Q2SMR0_9GAMM|nr:hypothetical protein [Candidatus Nitrosoglobus terrae]BAW80435.1 hypothetical conserved protein [Candidatus Nitrosoglobus terrae]